MVGGVEYRWVLSPDDGYMALLVSLLGRPGQRLRAYFNYHDVRVPTGLGTARSAGQRRAITPRVVRAVVLAALARGWRPSATGHAEFRLHEADDLVSLEDEASDA